MVTLYYRLKGRDCWHWHTQCHHLKAALKAAREFGALRDSKPRSGEFCDECISKTKADKRKRG